MSKTSTALRRFGVGVLSAATMSSGLVAFAGSASAATADINGVTLTPAAAATSTGDNTCQEYDVDLTNTSTGTAGGDVTIVLQPTATIDSQICTSGADGGTLTLASSTTSSTNGGADRYTYTTSDNHFFIGVDEANGTPSAGQIQIKAFPANGTSATPAAGAPSDTSLQTVVDAANQNEVVQTLTVDPATQAATEGQSADYTVSAVRGNNVVQDATVTYSIQSSQGNNAGSGSCGTTDYLGTVVCNVPAPSTISGLQTGPYTITFVVDHATGTDPSVTAQMTTADNPPNNANLEASCGDSTTPRDDINECEPSTSTNTVKVTGTVTTPATTTGGSPNPVSNVQVEFSFDSTSFADPKTTAALKPTSCVTDASGSCSVDVVVTGTITNGDSVIVHQFIFNGNQTIDHNFITWNNNFRGNAEKVSVSAGSPSATTGSTDVITATVSNTFGSQSGSGINVTFTVTGVGTFSNGATQQTVATGPNGQAQAALVSGAAGTSNVTATIDPNATDCSTATGGACSASVSVTWSKPTTTTHRVVVNLHLSCFSPRHHVVKCVAQLSRPISGVTVVFRNAAGTVVGRDVTNAAGKAVMKLRGLKSHKTHRYHAHAKRSARTFAADSNVAKVTVS